MMKKRYEKITVEVKNLTNNIFHIIFPNQYLLAATFLRFQEYYESPKFRNEFFTLEEYMDWYAEQNGAFTYCQDWSGFNIPSHILDPFYEGKFDPLTKKERILLSVFSNQHKAKETFYIVGTYEEKSNDTLEHEIAHGLFYTSEEYKKEVLSIIRGMKKKKIEKVLRKMGYCKEVLVDEIQAYLVQAGSTLEKEGVKLPKITMVKIRKVFGKYYN